MLCSLTVAALHSISSPLEPVEAALSPKIYPVLLKLTGSFCSFPKIGKNEAADYL